MRLGLLEFIVDVFTVMRRLSYNLHAAYVHARHSSCMHPAEQTLYLAVLRRLITAAFEHVHFCCLWHD